MQIPYYFTKEFHNEVLKNPRVVSQGKDYYFEPIEIETTLGLIYFLGYYDNYCLFYTESDVKVFFKKLESIHRQKGGTLRDGFYESHSHILLSKKASFLLKDPIYKKAMDTKLYGCRLEDIPLLLQFIGIEKTNFTYMKKHRSEHLLSKPIF